MKTKTQQQETALKIYEKQEKECESGQTFEDFYAYYCYQNNLFFDL